MAIFTMSDLHLSLDTDKSMEVFGYAWDNYINRIYDTWNSLVRDGDTVLVGGDISWAMHLADCRKDFEFLNSLNGNKILFKGNHDYWWESMTKMNAFLAANSFDTISFLQNDAILIEDVLVTGSRGWILPADSGFGEDDEKIYKRELIRLKMSLERGKSICNADGKPPKLSVCILHYPPFTKDHVPDRQITELLSEYNITNCYYGHLHSSSAKTAFQGSYGSVEYRLTSADYLSFTPIRIEF